MTDKYRPANTFLSWVHFGDLHIQHADDENYLDFLALIADVNQHLSGDLDFAFLPGDNADDGTASQYQLVRNALDQLVLPVEMIAGDHDQKSGSLHLFEQYLGKKLYRAVTLKGSRLLFLNALDGRTAKEFDFGSAQVAWLEEQLRKANKHGLRPLLFTHVYPSELANTGEQVGQLIREFQVELVEMGHTHYNELANDGQTIYAATRSTGQIEEGPPGFSITAIDGDVVSWKFKEKGPWPFVMVTSPSDERLITKPGSATHVVRGPICIKARLWGTSLRSSVVCCVDHGTAQTMKPSGNAWECSWSSQAVPDGRHSIEVIAETEDGKRASDEICVLVSQGGHYQAPRRHDIDYENTIGAYAGKAILGTQLGPNKNGTKGPWPSWRGR